MLTNTCECTHRFNVSGYGCDHMLTNTCECTHRFNVSGYGCEKCISNIVEPTDAAFKAMVKVRSNGFHSFRS